MLKLTKLMKKEFDVWRKLFLPKGTYLYLQSYDRTLGYQTVYTVRDGFRISNSENLDSPYHNRPELGAPVFLIIEITDRSDLTREVWETATNILYAGRRYDFEGLEPPTLVEPRLWRMRAATSGNGDNG